MNGVYVVRVTMEIEATDEISAGRIAWALLERIQDESLIDATVEKVEVTK